MIVQREKHITDRYKIVIYRQKRTATNKHHNCEVSVHNNNTCLIDYGQELLHISRHDTAIVIRKMRKSMWINYREYGYNPRY